MTSHQTNTEIKKILDKYLSHSEQVKLFTELNNVPGNKSFRDSVYNLLHLITHADMTNTKNT